MQDTQLIQDTRLTQDTKLIQDIRLTQEFGLEEANSNQVEQIVKKIKNKVLTTDDNVHLDNILKQR
jgi:hypothetical protein